MNYNKIGFWVALAFLLVSLGRIHEMIPGARYLAPGSLTTVILYVLVAGRLHTLRWSPVVGWRLLFFLSIIPGLFFGYNPAAVLKVFRSEFAETFAFFPGAILFFRTLDDLKKVRNALMILCAVFSLWVLTHGGTGPGMLGDENDAALLLVMLLPFPFFHLLERTTPLKYAISLAIFLIALLAIAATLSRGGMVGTVVVLLACWLKSRHKFSTLILFVILPGITVALGPNKIISEFLSITDTQELTAAERLTYWSYSWKMFLHVPWVGVGANSWGMATLSHIVDTGGRLFHNDTPHSIYFQLLSELGVFGVLTWLGLLVSCAFCFRNITSNHLKRQVGGVMQGNLNSQLLQEIEERRKFLAGFGLSLGIGLLGYLASGAFLSVLFYPMFCSFACLMQASKEAWGRELSVFKALNQNPP